MIACKNALARSFRFACMTILLISAAASAQDSSTPPAQPEAAKCSRVIKASVVALDQPVMINRLGAARPGWLFRRDYAGAGRREGCNR